MAAQGAYGPPLLLLPPLMLLAAQMAPSGLTSGSYKMSFSPNPHFQEGFRREMEGPWALGGRFSAKKHIFWMGFAAKWMGPGP